MPFFRAPFTCTPFYILHMRTRRWTLVWGVTPRGVFGVEHWDMSPPPWRRRRPRTPVAAPDGEATFWFCTLKKVNGKFSSKVFPKRPPKFFIGSVPKKKSTKVVLGTGGALSTVRPLGFFFFLKPLGAEIHRHP